MNMKRLRRLHQHIYDRVDLKIALKGCADEPEKVACLMEQIEEKNREISTLMDFIYSIDSPRARYALLAHCLWGMDWEDIAIMDGRREMPGSYRTAATRGIKNNRHGKRGAKRMHVGWRAICPNKGGQELDK